jgi:hypothetical protein
VLEVGRGVRFVLEVIADLVIVEHHADVRLPRDVLNVDAAVELLVGPQESTIEGRRIEQPSGGVDVDLVAGQ